MDLSAKTTTLTTNTWLIYYDHNQTVRLANQFFLDFVIRFGEDVDLDIPSCSAILDDEQHPGVGGDDLLVGGGDGMVPGPVLLVGVCLLEPI